MKLPYRSWAVLLALAAAARPQAASAASAYDAAVLADKPVLFLGMDTAGAGSQADLSGRGNNGTYVNGKPGTTTLPNGDRAAVFNGAGQYLTVPHRPELSVPTSGVIVVEAWIRPSTLNFPDTENENFVYFLGKGNAAQGHEYANRMYSKSSIRPNRTSIYSWNLSGGLGSGAYFQDAWDTQKWVMVTSVINMRDKSSSYPTGYVSIYKNGTLRLKVRLDQYDVIPGVSQAPFNVGTRDHNSYFQGAIGKVAIYGHLLSDAQIRAHYAAMSGSLTVGPGDPSPSAAYEATPRFLTPATADGVNDAAIFGPGAIDVEVFDTLGRRVFEVTGGGVVWNGRDMTGRLVESGVYVAKILRDNGSTAYQSLVVAK